jgi:hypothetical protein
MQEAKITAAEDQLFCLEFAVSCAKFQILNSKSNCHLKASRSFVSTDLRMARAV